MAQVAFTFVLLCSLVPTCLSNDHSLWHTRHQFLRHQRAAANSASAAQSNAPGSNPVRSRSSCFEAIEECKQRFGCAPALKNARRICDIPLFYESVRLHDVNANASASVQRPARCLEGPLCVQTLSALVNSRDGVGDHPNDGIGRRLASCGCMGNAYCEEQKRRMLPCRQRAELLKTRYQRALKSGAAKVQTPAQRVSCSLAGFMCQSDGICVYKLSEMLRYCNASLTSRNAPVSDWCKNAANTLHGERRGRPLFTCVCARDMPPVVPFDYPCADFVTTLQRAHAAFAGRPATAPVATRTAGIDTESDLEAANRVARAVAANDAASGVGAPRLSGYSGRSDSTEPRQRPPPP